MSEVIAEAGRRATRRGSPPCPARTWPLEIARGLPASAVVAADGRGARRARSRPGSAGARFRLYVNRDVLGVELCGALKNVVAIAAGAADGARLRRQRQGRPA